MANAVITKSVTKDKILLELYPNSKPNPKVAQYLRDLMNLCITSWDILYVVPECFHKLAFGREFPLDRIRENTQITEESLKLLAKSKPNYKRAYDEAITLYLLRN